MGQDAQCDDRQRQVDRHRTAGAHQTVVERIEQVVNAADPTDAEPTDQAAMALRTSTWRRPWSCVGRAMSATGLPAMGSDIPVFREIGGEFMAYFDLEAPQRDRKSVV